MMFAARMRMIMPSGRRCPSLHGVAQRFGLEFRLTPRAAEQNLHAIVQEPMRGI
jgi:hypothetical protein